MRKHNDDERLIARVRRRRDDIRRKPGLAHTYRVTIFALGFVFIALGLMLSVLPGPLTIPPVLLGLWIWSTEFAWAHRLFESMKRKADYAWEHAKARPKRSASITAAGLAIGGAAIWAAAYFDVVDRGRNAIGL